MTDIISNARPFLKWAGGKRQLIPVIEENLPKQILDGTIERYIEPFIGGGALFFHLRENFPLKEFFISDFNPDLINTYVSVRDHLDALIKELEKIANEYLPLDHEERSEVFYRVRTEYNLTRSCLDSNLIQEKIVRAAQMIFLNRTCFNGLYRVNSKGDYNVPHGRYKNPQICDSENLHLVSEALQNVTITCGSYEACFENVNDKTFIYFDPPYRPLPNTPSFTDYAQKATFGDADQEKLSVFFKQITSDKKCFAMLSNSDPHVTDENDDFFDVIYSGFDINRVGARRAINSDGNKRGKITELLITNYNSL